MTRQRWAEILIPINAMSMVLQYVIQGAMASGEVASNLPWWFWPADWAFWGVRALVESTVILYLFKTEASKRRDKFALAFFEIVLISLMMLTIGPTIRALVRGQSMEQALTGWQLTAWTFGLGAYGGLMLAGVGVAYRIQPSDVEMVSLEAHQSIVESLEGKLTDTQDDYNRAQRELSSYQYLSDWRQALARFPTDKQGIVARTIFSANGSELQVNEIIEALGVSRGTVIIGQSLANAMTMILAGESNAAVHESTGIDLRKIQELRGAELRREMER
jgi:hypothetical protein